MDFLFTSLCFEWLDLREELWETRKALKWTGFPATFPCQSVLRYSYGSIPIPFVGGMNIHLPAILKLGLPGFWPTGQRPLCASLGNRTRHSKRFPSASTKVMFSSSFGLSWQKNASSCLGGFNKTWKSNKDRNKTRIVSAFSILPPCCCFISLIFCWIFEIGNTLVLQSW